MGIIEVFSFGDHLLDAPLNEREFRFNVFDCLSALRSWVWQNEGRYMPPKAYEAGWWTVGMDDPSKLSDNPNLYEKHFEDYGYREFTPDFNNANSMWHPKVGDVLLMQMGAPVINHVAVYEGNNLIYHHRVNHKSGPTPIGYLLGTNVIRKWVRYEGTNEQN
jgi:cell wall-associated NlpC family hydrolase